MSTTKRKVPRLTFKFSEFYEAAKEQDQSADVIFSGNKVTFILESHGQTIELSPEKAADFVFSNIRAAFYKKGFIDGEKAALSRGLANDSAEPSKPNVEMLNIGRLHYEVNHATRTYSLYGSNIFENWKHEDPKIWEKNQALLSTYRELDSGRICTPGDDLDDLPF